MNLPSGKLTQIKCAILLADIVNYSELTETNETKTHENLTQRFRVIKKIVKSKRGTIVRLRGDSVMATFPTSEEAVYCASEIQTAATNLNNHSPTSEQINFRIGVNYGYIVLDEGEPYGNEVNITARLQELATPNDIYLSEQAHLQLNKYIPFSISYVAKFRVPNIKQPIKVYKICNLPKIKSASVDSLNKWLRIKAANVDSLIKLSIALSASSLAALMLTIGLLVFNDAPFWENISNLNKIDSTDQTLSSDDPIIANNSQDLGDNESIKELHALATSHLIKGRLNSPRGDNALETYQKILLIDGDNSEAQFGISRIYQHYTSLAESQLRTNNYEAATEYLQIAQTISPNKSEAYLLQIRLLGQRHQEKILALSDMQDMLKNQYEKKIKYFHIGQAKQEEYVLLNQQLIDRNKALQAKLAMQLESINKQKQLNQGITRKSTSNLITLNKDNTVMEISDNKEINEPVRGHLDSYLDMIRNVRN